MKLAADWVVGKIRHEGIFVDVAGNLKDAGQFRREVVEEFEADLDVISPGMPASRDYRKQVNAVHPPAALRRFKP
jgi:hypothetical protein